mmetsp:Transcript_15293/g.39488  ORF Transcript_15293/g.39488 Transcript_15293/m.39488 type:complete len:503 (-) Transcript_15293:26-1534(-)
MGRALHSLLLLLAATLPCAAASGEAHRGELVVLHLTDLHIDLQYAPGSEAECATPPCCRQASDPSVAIKTQASMAGEYKCDTRPQLLQSALEAVQAMRPDMVLWTGDTAPHHPSTTQEDVVDSLSFVVRELVKALPGVPVFPSLGNYDFVPVHSDPGPPLNQWLLAPAASLFGAWLGEDALSTFRYAGYYEAKVKEGLRVVALNTQMCHIKNLFQFVDDTLAQEQLAWLEGVLQRAQSSNERVLITGHVPPGMYGGCWGRASKEYELLLFRYRDALAGQVYGHQHSGSFRLLRENAEYLGAPFAVAHVSPGFTPYQGGNPTFRVYHLGPSAGSPYDVVDFQQFFLPLNEYDSSSPGLSKKVSIEWMLGYSPRHTFNITDMSAKGWQQLRDTFDSDTAMRVRYQTAERSSRPWQGPGESGDYLCGVSHVSDGNLQECIGTNEEILVRKYAAATHTYVITAMFPFESVLDYFCPVLQGIHPSDCPPRLYHADTGSGMGSSAAQL